MLEQFQTGFTVAPSGGAGQVHAPAASGAQKRPRIARVENAAPAVPHVITRPLAPPTRHQHSVNTVHNTAVTQYVYAPTIKPCTILDFGPMSKGTTYNTQSHLLREAPAIQQVRPLKQPLAHCAWVEAAARPSVLRSRAHLNEINSRIIKIYPHVSHHIITKKTK